MVGNAVFCVAFVVLFGRARMVMVGNAVFCVAFVMLFGRAKMAHLVPQRDVT
jgi:hypothetical protein